MAKVGIAPDGHAIYIDISSDTTSTDALAARMTELLPTIEAISRAEIAFRELDTVANLKAISAQNMKYQAALHFATAQAELLERICKGTANIADYGFPEFGVAKKEE